MRKAGFIGLAVLSLLVWMPGGAYGQVASFVPQNPRIGDVVDVTYTPRVPGAAILNAKALTLHTLVLPQYGMPPTLIETPLTPTGTTWKGSFTLTQSGARFLLHQFVSGDLKDDNAGQGWGGMVLGADGKELEGARYWRSIALSRGGYQGFKFRTDPRGAKAEITRERKQFPDNYSAVNMAWYLETNPVPTAAATSRIKKELEGELRRFRNNEDALPMILVWLEQTQQKKRADSLRSVFIAERPKGRVAAVSQMIEISLEKDRTKKVARLEDYVRNFSLKEDDLLGVQRQLIAEYVETTQYEKGYQILKSNPKLDPALYRTLASAMIGTNKQVEEAVSWLAEGIALARRQDESSKPLLMTMEDWQRNRKETLAGLLATRGLGLTKLGRSADAEGVLVEAYRLKEGTDVAVNENLMNAYVSNAKFKEAEELGVECICKAKSNLNIVTKLKEAFKREHGSLAEYDKRIREARAREELSILKTGLNREAPPFSLMTMKGETVRLSDLRGKVVVLSFWSTWSSLSKDLFFQLQKAYEVYRDYRNVTFLTVNTGEHLAGPKREAAVKKFMDDGKFSMPVAYDNGLATAQLYGIEGIPVCLVLDKNGRIQFQRVGFSGSKNVVDELTTQIEVLLKH